MKYRIEVDGLRAIAVLPVIFGHAGFSLFHGGFVGVDIFFVISGYLITTIIMGDLDAGRFSVLRFYDRRLRRILPALFLVIAATLPFAYLWMMPDEFKNFGQSIVATLLFSNNMLLAMTADYWSLESMFKPLIHTWSLGVEEQYYMIVPVALFLMWKYARAYVLPAMVVLFIFSLMVAVWGVAHFPAIAFYILPTRGWELLAGAILAYWLAYRAAPSPKGVRQEVASLAGLAMIAGSVVGFDDSFLSPGLWLLIPVGGAVLVIAFAVEGTLAYRLLSSRVLVGIGLISYSLYLWHQPLFALARIHAVDQVGPQTYAMLIVANFILSYLTWRFVEAPFRNREMIGRRSFIAVSVVSSICLLGAGLYLNKTYGMYWRVFDRNENIADIDKRIYNSRVFEYKKSHFDSDGRRRIFVVGDSFGRDFINMTTETFDVSNIEIAYSDTAQACIENRSDSADKSLFDAADIIVFASGYDTPDSIRQHCVQRDITWADERGKEIFFVGTKHFGYNLNWIIQLSSNDRANQYNKIPEFSLRNQKLDEEIVPSPNFISLLGAVSRDGMVPITDNNGKMLSTDRRHVTKYGAIYFGDHALKPSAYGALLMRRVGSQ
ncbi:acyltransferase family protein [Ancylobacter amanitiformis]|uniref:Peptidoglycan/LPS O-acetylase OafA/YrhL n=1 Tax=Ancylobacter amanitiformis TaxID=217069 RepID=A0ABU0LS40_9HYPH|nr:acyltransferase [Ancylobacter amanitiformis]MDQ0511519.1 peptidoglycan/LPS O-acetylase OafA/YrhL [Ancylobacter amanitiformis]